MTTQPVAHGDEAVGMAATEAAHRDARPLARWVRAHPVGAFLAWFFTVGWAIGFIPVVDLGFRSLFAFFIVELGSRRVVPVGVTRHPTDAWIAQQLREATPFGTAPRFLIRGNDGRFGPACARVAAGSRIGVRRTPVRAPRAHAACARFLGSVRRECLDHILVLSEAHLRRVLRDYIVYFNRARPHQGRGSVIPDAAGPAPLARSPAPLVSVPVLGGLHHDYRRAA
jgi:transposase InsO family protein